MNIAHYAKLAFASAAIALAAPAAAQDRAPDDDNTIYVQPSAAEAQYVMRVARQLDRNLGRVPTPLRIPHTGIVRVRFNADEDGEPENVRLVDTSASNQLERSALWAVRRLNDIAPDFAGDPQNQEIQANIIFANSERQARRMTRQLMREEQVRIAAEMARGETPVLALTLAATTAQ